MRLEFCLTMSKVDWISIILMINYSLKNKRKLGNLDGLVERKNPLPSKNLRFIG